jgi:hypothetical protein
MIRQKMADGLDCFTMVLGMGQVTMNLFGKIRYDFEEPANAKRKAK